MDCKLSGNLKLKSKNGNFLGEGKFFLSKLAANRQDLEVSIRMAQDGVRIGAHVTNPEEFLKISAYLPINWRSDGSIRRNMHDNLLDCRIAANTHLERLLELPDNSDLRGNLIGNFHITGNFSYPMISGKAQLQRAFIAIGDVTLKNGTISLTAEGGNVISARAEFVDYKKKKATVSGSGKLFFNGVIPNIDTNLHLKFNDFALFDSDDIKIDIIGEGCMKGPIDSMIIQGNVVVPKCTIQDFTSAESELDIAIENDTYLNDTKKNGEKKDFFKYDISMHCPNVEFAGSIFKMHLRGDLLLSTHQEKRTLSGELKLFDGKLDLFGKRMTFIDGKVVFLREYPFDPKASFNCQRNFGDISVGLNIKNSPGKGVSLNLYSSPSHTTDMILSKMLFGKESRYLTITEAVQLAHAVASLNQHGYIFSVLNTFQNIGVVDNVSFANSDNQSSSLYLDSQNTSTQNNINVSAGKYIHDNVYVSANKKGETTSFDIDFSITPKISVKANTKGEAGLSWKYRY
jgi:autotransporter translocation and assembly factor TamB